MYSDYVLNQLMQEYYDYNLGADDHEYPQEEYPEINSTGLSPDDEF